MGAWNRLGAGFLCWFGAAVVAVGLSACGGESSNATQGGGGNTTSTPTAGTTSGSTTSSGTTSSGACGDIEQTPGDCKKNVCEDGKVVGTPDDTDIPDDQNDCTADTCSDGDVMNTPTGAGSECAQDGGKVCDGSGNCVECVADADCTEDPEKPACKDFACVGIACNDMFKNGDETDVDCGGSCGATCNPGQACEDGDDCKQGVCKLNTCLVPTCGDGVQNGTETDIDCGGSCAAGFNLKKCGPDQGCMVDADCIGSECSGTVCVPNCNDGVKNNGEVDEDCGGPNCSACDNGQVCTTDSDCSSGHCVGSMCCNTVCDLDCQACSAAAKGSGVDGVCGAAKAGEPCGPPATCMNGEQTAQDTCDALGMCIDAGLTPCSPYVCGAMTCKSSCVDDMDCDPSATCAMGLCQLPLGLTCAKNSDCASGFCADKVCCEDACLGACRACTAAKKGTGMDGQCGDVETNTDPDDECVGLLNCGAGQCQISNGQPCLQASECVSGNCVDGVCCNGPCTTTCQACTAAKKGSGADGTCGNIAINSDPDDECAGGSSCNGAGSCALAPNGTPCAVGSECSSGNCVDSVCCNTPCSGSCLACTAVKKGSGLNGLCGSIATGTDPDNECAGNTVCAAGGCKLPNGEPCVSGSSCIAGFCADGVCCNVACNGTCQACTAAKKSSGLDGECGNIPVGTDPDNECGGATTCSGAGTCALKPDGAACMTGPECTSGFCTDGVCCNILCNGACQACTGAKKGSGTDGLCGSIGAGLDPDNECAGSSSCSGAGACVLAPNGAPCMGSGECTSGFCTDGVCCNVLCNTACNACTAAKKGQGADGTCGPIVAGADPDSECPGSASCGGGSSCTLLALGVPCTLDAECANGFCVDGVCCSSVCNSPCNACTATKKGSGTNGTCGTIASGTDPDNECAGVLVCNGSGACKAQLGDPCVQGSDCISTFCADGVCCNNACNTTCNACTATKKGSGANGTCGFVASGTDPDNECFGTFTCNGAGVCALLANGAACMNNAECSSNFCVDGVCCNTACNSLCNACTALKKGSGADGTCGNVATATDPDNECPGSQVCNASAQCKGANGDVCVLGTDCNSNNCVDGVCCNTACNTLCQACTNMKKGYGVTGVCEPIQSGSDPDNECFGTYNCNGSGACTLLGLGAACMANGECASGFCADGVCCNTACNTLCNACTAVKKGQGTDGTCGTIAAGLDPDNECAGSQVCNNGSACKIPQGDACVLGTDCLSANCIDGVCCNTICNTLCQACSAAKKGGGADGVCAPIANGTDPDSECLGMYSCNGAGACNLLGIGAACMANSDCASNFCVDGVCCNTACNTLCNACTAAKRGQGTDGTCGTIAAGLDPDNECAGSQVCNNGSACKIPQGDACLLGTDCLSTFCVDGVCCNNSCTTLCNACSEAKKGAAPDGTCAPIANGTDPDNECIGMYSCNGSGACNLLGIGTACMANSDCASNFCVDGVCCNNACNTLCNACTAAKKGSGTDGTCGVVASGMDPDAECTGSQVCNGFSACKIPQGDACVLGTDCLSGNCVDGVCCNSTCTALCQACSAAKKGGGSDGVCGNVGVGTDPDNECFSTFTCNGSGACNLLAIGSACSNNAECVSPGLCVDGVCCNGACNGLCQACSAVKKAQGTDGTCGSILGGIDPDAECTGALVCNGAATPACKVQQGDTCVLGTDCVSGQCFDGVCCNASCTTACNACTAAKKGSGVDGVCGSIAVGTDPDAECPGATNCNGVSACSLFSQGTACTINGECSNNICVDNVCCNTTCTTLCNACTAAKKNSGVDGQCGVIANNTDPDNECPGGTSCNGASACTLFGVGTACSINGECANGNCIDNFCCNNACSGLCRACSNTKTGLANGTCGDVVTGTDPDNECTAPTPNCAPNLMCGP